MCLKRLISIRHLKHLKIGYEKKCFAARSFSKSPYIVHSHTFYIASRGDLAEKLLLLIGIAPTGTEVHNDLGARERTNLKRQSNIFSRVESSLQRFLTETEGRGKMT